MTSSTTIAASDSTGTALRAASKSIMSGPMLEDKLTGCGHLSPSVSITTTTYPGYSTGYATYPFKGLPITSYPIFQKLTGNNKEDILITYTRKDNRMVRSLDTLSEWAKRLLDKDKQDLYRAGYINSHGAPTMEGNHALFLLMWEANEAALIKKAQEAIAQDEKENA